ncbi:MAG: PEP-CTERM sorting domain-containing protein [bacterium]|nr:PEP-CTERM sorting domain-containing protein [bacterium]
MARRRYLAVTSLLVASWLFATPAPAQEIVSASPDITIDLGTSVITTDEDVALDNQLGIVLLENLGALPDASNVIALGVDLNGDRLIAFETTTALAGGVVARPGDVVRYDTGATYSIEFDASAEGVPAGVKTDSVSLSPVGLLLSFDTTVDLGGGLVVADEDLVDWNGSSFALAFDGSAEGVDPALDVDAAQDLGSGHLLLSFDTTGQIAGLVFDDEDVVRFDGANWSLEFDASAADPDWAAADLDAVMVPEPSMGGLLLAGASGLVWMRRSPR